MYEWRLESVSLERKELSGKQGDEIEVSIFADETETTDEGEGIWSHEAKFDNELFLLEIEWRIKTGDEEASREDILKEMREQQFTVSHFTNFMGLGSSPMFPLEEKEYEQLHESQGSRDQ